MLTLDVVVSHGLQGGEVTRGRDQEGGRLPHRRGALVVSRPRKERVRVSTCRSSASPLTPTLSPFLALPFSLSMRVRVCVVLFRFGRQEFDLTPAEAERKLREADGDPVRALRLLAELVEA